jgi:hypothetical protein
VGHEGRQWLRLNLHRVGFELAERRAATLATGVRHIRWLCGTNVTLEEAASRTIYALSVSLLALGLKLPTALNLPVPADSLAL